MNHLEIAMFKSTIFEDEVNFSPRYILKEYVERLTTLKKKTSRDSTIPLVFVRYDT